MKKRSVYGILLCLFLFFAIEVVLADELKVKPEIREGAAWYNTQQWLPEAQGWSEGMGRYYARFPARAEKSIPKGVWNLSQHSSGLYFRFKTDAETIFAKYKCYSANLAMPHMPATGVSGLDLYVLHEGKWLWAGVTMPSKQEAQYTLISGMEKKMREYMLYLPLYNGVETLEIGVPEKAAFEAIAPHRDGTIVYYGTSIAHGGCASRPGMAYTAILGRRLNVPVINLGFSGSGRMEMEMADLIRELDPAVFVFDTLPNMSPDQVAERAIPFIQKIRDKHPTTPILLVEDRSFSNAYLRPGTMAEHELRRKHLKTAFDHFKAAGDKNIYYLSANDLLGENEDQDGTVDSSHPNDLGMYRQTNKLESVLRPILKK